MRRPSGTEAYSKPVFLLFAPAELLQSAFVLSSCLLVSSLRTDFASLRMPRLALALLRGWNRGPYFEIRWHPAWPPNGVASTRGSAQLRRRHFRDVLSARGRFHLFSLGWDKGPYFEIGWHPAWPPNGVAPTRSSPGKPTPGMSTVPNRVGESTSEYGRERAESRHQTVSAIGDSNFAERDFGPASAKQLPWSCVAA